MHWKMKRWTRLWSAATCTGAALLLGTVCFAQADGGPEAKRRVPAPGAPAKASTPPAAKAPPSTTPPPTAPKEAGKSDTSNATALTVAQFDNLIRQKLRFFDGRKQTVRVEGFLTPVGSYKQAAKDFPTVVSGPRTLTLADTKKGTGPSIQVQFKEGQAKGFNEGEFVRVEFEVVLKRSDLTPGEIEFLPSPYTGTKIERASTPAAPAPPKP